MTINAGMMSSKTDQWGTPQDYFDQVNGEFHFDLDVCAEDWNAKCKDYISPEQDALSVEWHGNVCWMNPPYGREIGHWMKKAVEEWKRDEGRTVVCLVPARTDTAWWHDFAMQGEIRFLRGRLKFVSPEGGKDAAPFPSALVIYQGGRGQA